MKEKCKFSWCDKEVHAHGMCGGHLTNIRKHGEPNPPLFAKIIGPRTLLAKTCRTCGEFKPRSAFTTKKNKGVPYANNNCTPCVVIYNRSHRPKNPKSYSYTLTLSEEDKARYRDRRNKAMKQENDRFRDIAKKHQQVYTSNDLDILTRTDLSSKEKATILGRTIRAVNNKRYKMRKAKEQ